jgi:phage-related minor tail protein
MDEEIERLLVSVRADTGGFARDVAEMRAQLDGPLAQSMDVAGRAIEGALIRAVRNGKLGFEDLKRVALSAMAEIAASAIRTGLSALAGGGGGAGGGGSGLLALGTQLLMTLAGAPGRATGGPVSPGRPYLVGERGPEMFVPTSSGRIEPGGSRGGREVRLSIAINAPAGTEPRALERSSRQVARAVKQALMRVED